MNLWTVAVTLFFKQHLRRTFLVALLLSMSAANAALFDDDEARRAILDLRQKIELIQQKSAEDLRKVNEENTQLNGQLLQLRRSVLELSGQIENSRDELARVLRVYGEERFARRIADAIVARRAAAPITPHAWDRCRRRIGREALSRKVRSSSTW